MIISTLDLTNARETVHSLLEQLQLDAYLFEVEPREGRWLIQIDCGLGEEWQSLELEVENEQLQACKTAGQAREELLTSMDKQFQACARTGHKAG